MRRIASIAVAVAVAAVVAAGCTSGDAADDSGVRPIGDGEQPDAAGDDTDAESDPEPDPDPEQEPEPEPDADDEEIERFAVPDEIGVDYLEAVLDRMHEGLVPGIRSAIDAGAITDELDAAIADIYVDELIEFETERWQRHLDRDPDSGLLLLADEPEARTNRLAQPVLLSDDCVIALVDVDTGPWYGRTDLEAQRNLVILLRGEPAPPVNPTPWRVDADAAHDEDGVPDWALERCD